MKKALWKGIQTIFKPLYKALSQFLKHQADFFKDFVISRVSLEIEYYLAIAPLLPEVFNKKLPKLINKISDQNIKKSCNKILKIASNLGFFSINFQYCICFR